jgi:hypothetical protein
LKQEIASPLAKSPAPQDKHLLTVLLLAFVLGMAIAIGVYMAWRRGLLAPAFSGPASAVALLLCPPYILSIAVGPMADADLIMAVTAGAIVLGNGFLYAGVAAGGYYLATMRMKRKRI